MVNSHGKDGDTLVADHWIEVKLDDLIKVLCSNVTLKGKPKIFLFNCCRGKGTNTDPSFSTVSKLLEEEDVPVGYATLEGQVK